MFGRRGAPRQPDEAAPHLYRAEFIARFQRLRRRHGVRNFLAHSLTVTPANLGEVADVARTVSRMGFGLLASQPAAWVGDEQQHRGSVDPDTVWAEIGRGIGARLDHRLFENGDVRCNRVRRCRPGTAGSRCSTATTRATWPGSASRPPDAGTSW